MAVPNIYRGSTDIAGIPTDVLSGPMVVFWMWLISSARPERSGVGPPTHQVPRGPHSGRIHIGQGKIASSNQPGDLQRVDPVILGLHAMNGLHIQGVAKIKSMPSCSHKSASQYQQKIHSTPTTRSPRKGAIACRNRSGSRGLFL